MQNLEEPGFHSATVEIETPRGRQLGTAVALFVDVPWGMASKFVQITALRGQVLRGCRVEHFVVNGTKGRPTRDAAFQTADGWIAGQMEDATAQEYLTGQEEEQALSQAGDANGVPAGDNNAMVERLLARVAELEEQAASVKHQQMVGSQAPALPGRPARAPPLFGSPDQTLSAGAWDRIQKLAGSPPPRVGAVEKKRAAPLKTQLQDAALMDVEREAEDFAEGEHTLAAIAAYAGDPIQQMLAAQMQQNQMLLKRLVGSQKDPLLAAEAAAATEAT